MNDFEKLLRGVLDRTDTFLDASYTGRACYALLSKENPRFSHIFSSPINGAGREFS